MTIQTGNLGTAPSGAGGDTFRSFATKMNENFTNNTHAASRLVGAATGNVMEVGAFGIGGTMVQIPMPSDSQFLGSGFYYFDVGGSSSTWQQVETNVFVMRNSFIGGRSGFEIGCLPYSNRFYLRGNSSNVEWRTPVLIRHSGNTSVDSNGFVKAASPIIKLFAEKIEPNEEALEQEPTFEKVDVGHYLLKNTEGFSDDGWYIEMPKDANGNVLVAVQYQQTEDNTIEVKTFVKKFDEETGDIVPNLEKPRDIPAGRWIDIRLKALPQPEIEITNTPADFQPTNLAQAIAEALKDDSE
ncbi:phage tail fiber protein [Acinetobacter bereziniae]|uniref:phage tail fiber protein n=1 Tax=Acinetobacter bereziniae TaxID=106648 RepID=UPI0015DB1ED4|nr:hypothetical protein [Acinetobacter bereziniae]